MTEAHENGNRRAEIDGNVVTFHRMSGKVRRSKHQVWKVVTDDIRRARRLAKRWVNQAKLGDPVLKGV
jgi:hypothetical protein